VIKCKNKLYIYSAYVKEVRIIKEENTVFFNYVVLVAEIG